MYKRQHGGSDEEGLDSTTIRMPDYKGKSISGRVITARKVDRSTAVSYTHLDVYKRQGEECGAWRDGACRYASVNLDNE